LLSSVSLDKRSIRQDNANHMPGSAAAICPAVIPGNLPQQRDLCVYRPEPGDQILDVLPA
jgi:hypothetical protein